MTLHESHVRRTNSEAAQRKLDGCCNCFNTPYAAAILEKGSHPSFISAAAGAQGGSMPCA
jgi:hypothetical protein